MPIELPNLDDRRFADLVEEGRRLIPGFAPGWTDHNPSDPGITFVELFAAVAEMLMYRVNRVSEPNKRAFLELLAPDLTPTPGWTVDQEISAAIRKLRIEDRAVTADDFERLARQVPGVLRAHAVPRRDLEARRSPARAEALGHISVIVITAPARDGGAAVMTGVRKFLASRALIATRVHVVPPVRLTVAVRLKLRIHPDQLKDVVQRRAVAALEAFFDPLTGGRAGGGWPFGAPVYRADIYALLDQVEGVDSVDLSSASDDLLTIGSSDRQIKPAPTAKYVGLSLEANELVAFSLENSTIECLPPKTTIPA